MPVPPLTAIAWNLDPLLGIGLALTAWAYARGLLRLWQRAGAGHGIRVWQAGCFVAGLAALFVALISPLDPLSAVVFSAHMAQHLALMLAAAPLLVLGRPLIALVWALPPGARRTLGAVWRRARWARAAWNSLSLPPVGWLLAAGALWLWHAPMFYQAALRSAPIHALEHASFLGTALLFWRVVLYPHGGPRRYGVSILLVFTAAVQSGVLGALLTFSPVPWYPLYAHGVAAWGLSAIEDQQLAGLIMWIPASVIYLGAVAALFVRWLAAAEQAARRRDRRMGLTPGSARSLANES